MVRLKKPDATNTKSSKNAWEQDQHIRQSLSNNNTIQ